MSDTAVGAGAGWVLSSGGVFSPGVAEVVAVSSRGSAGVVEATGVSVCCDGGSVAWARGEDNSFGIEVVVASLTDVTGEELSSMEFGAAGATACGLRGAMCSADEIACWIVWLA